LRLRRINGVCRKKKKHGRNLELNPAKLGFTPGCENEKDNGKRFYWRIGILTSTKSRYAKH